MPQESKKVADEGCCAMQRKVDRKWWCQRCLAGLWGQRCDNKALWKRTDTNTASMLKDFSFLVSCLTLMTDDTDMALCLHHTHLLVKLFE